jgi:hypothetical protein
MDGINGRKDVLLKFAGDDVCENFKLAVGVGSEPSAGRNSIFVDYAQRSKELVLMILIPEVTN